MTERQLYLDDAIHAAWREGNDKLRRELQEELQRLIKEESKNGSGELLVRATQEVSRT